jgi:hypothetical protein
MMAALRRAAHALAVASALAPLACTELDALGGSEPPLPWSDAVPRWGPTPRASGSAPYGMSTVIDAGALELVTDLPRAAADCLEDHLPALCDDADRDGLVDEWEDLALDTLRPFVRIDEGDPLRVDADGRVGSVGRVAPAPDGAGEERIRLLLVLAYSRDYGRCTFGAHLGDSERVALDLAPVPGERGAVRVVRAYTAAHEWSEHDASRLFDGDLAGQLEVAEDTIAGQPRWVVHASRAKHATYATAALCEAEDSWIFCGDEDCAAGRSISPPNELLIPVDNAGELDAPRAGSLMDEPVWDDVPFCGGLGHGRGPCASPLRDKLLTDPFAASSGPDG